MNPPLWTWQAAVSATWKAFCKGPYPVWVTIIVISLLWNQKHAAPFSANYEMRYHILRSLSNSNSQLNHNSKHWCKGFAESPASKSLRPCFSFELQDVAGSFSFLPWDCIETSQTFGIIRVVLLEPLQSFNLNDQSLCNYKLDRSWI